MNAPPLLLGLVVAATDLSDGARPAFRFAADLAARTSSALHLVYVNAVSGRLQRTGEVSEDDVRAWAAETVSPVPDVRLVLEEGISPAECILRYVEKTGADLLVVGTHGRRGLRRFVIGSTAEELVRLSPCPVLTIPSRAGAASPERAGPVLVPVDFSDRSVEAVSWARRWAALYGTSLDLLHVVEEGGPYPSFYFDAERPPLVTLVPELEGRAREELERLARGAEGPEVEVRVHVRAGKAPREIVRFAEEHEAGVIVMATQGLTGVDHFLIGSTSERSVRLARCPVVTLRPDVVRDEETGAMTPRAEYVRQPTS
jgi:nucleotide-binding universal stress UspA family protein